MVRDVERILGLPVSDPPTEAETAKLTAEVVQRPVLAGRCRCRICATLKALGRPFRLFRDQAWGLRDFRRTLGLFGGIEVGGGKTALAYLVAAHYFERKPEGRILYLLPPDLCVPLEKVHLPWARTHFDVWVPRWIFLNGRRSAERLAYARCHRAGVYVLPYSLLSTEDAAALLEAIDADLVIGDEAHAVAGTSSSGRNAAFWSWLDSRDAERRVRGAVLSGTFNRTSLQDAYKLLRWVLGEQAPVPMLKVDLDSWDGIMRAGAELPTRAQCLSVRPLVRWAHDLRPDEFNSCLDEEGDPSEATETVRTAYRIRLSTAPGVVLTPGDEVIATSLKIEEFPCEQPGPVLREHLRRLEEEWATPEGDLLAWAIEKHEHLRQLSCGFYLHHYWDESKPCVEEAKRCWDARRDYVSQVRHFLGSAAARRLKLYLPRALGKRLSAGPIPGWEPLHDAWRRWKELDVPGLPERSTRVVRVDDYKVRAVAAWAKRHARGGGVVWAWHEAFADWLEEGLRGAKFDVARRRAGDEWLQGDGTDGRVVVASIAAFGQGHNLQHYRAQVLAEWCRTAWRMEQLLGRLHRPGQAAAELTAHLIPVLPFDRESIAATLYDALYDVQTFGGRRKLLIADWLPEPEQFPPELLRTHGFQLKRFGSTGDEEDGPRLTER